MTHRECPNCASSSIADSRQKSYEFPLNLFCLKPYRCVRCETRFWSLSDRQIRKVLPLLKYGISFLLCFGVIWMIILVAVQRR
jgi:hypothetical protein